jgi:hypothetical protein
MALSEPSGIKSALAQVAQRIIYQRLINSRGNNILDYYLVKYKIVG